MQRFFERIQKKALDVRQPPVLVVAFGDSITQGAMEHSIFAPGIVYHRILQQILEEFYPTTTFSTINAGVSGDSATEALGRLERDVIRHQPDLVFISFGTNDAVDGTSALSAFKESLTHIIAQVRLKTKAEIVLLTPPHAATRLLPNIHPEHRKFTDAVIKTQNEGMISRYADAIREIGLTQKIPVADVYREWTRLRETNVDTDLWLINGLNHPDYRGHHLTARLIFNLLLSQRNEG